MIGWRSQNVGWGYLLLDDIAFTDDETHQSFLSTEIKLNDVLLNITGASIGRSVVADDRLLGGNVNQHVCIIRAEASKLNPFFLNFFLLSKSGQKQIESFQAGGNRQGLNFEPIKSFQIPLPPLPEQVVIATALSDVGALLTSLDKLIAKKRDIKQATMQQLLTGKMRLPGFSGEWRVKKLDGIAEIVMGQSPVGSSYNRDGNGHPLINGPTEFTDRYPIKIQWTSQPTKFCKQNDILLCVRGSSTGRINIANDEYCIGRGIAAIRAKAGSDTKYVTFQVQCAVINILALTTGSTFPSIDRKSIKSIEFPYPSLSEQQAIATVLSDMDAEIVALERKRDKIRAVKQGMMQELLTGKIRLL